jgi:exosome complex component RRP40
LRQYLPQPQDLVLARVHHSASEHYHCTITPHNVYALLPHLAFENATKKTRPQLAAGALVYARVTSSLAHNKFQEPEIACFNASTGKSEGLGELKGGMVFDVSLRMVRQLLVPKRKPGNEGMSIKGISLSRDVAVLELLGKKMAFEVAVGRNGRIWVDAGSIRKTLLVGKALQETDEGHLNRQRQEMLVKRLLRETT